MEMTVEHILAMAAAGPVIYGIICLIRRSFNARKTARWVKETHPEEWNRLHWVVGRNPRAGIESLISEGLISGSEVDEFCTRDEYLEKAAWLGLLVSAALLLVILLWKIAVSVSG